MEILAGNVNDVADLDGEALRDSVELGRGQAASERKQPLPQLEPLAGREPRQLDPLLHTLGMRSCAELLPGIERHELQGQERLLAREYPLGAGAQPDDRATMKQSLAARAQNRALKAG